jgi:hypothetical protein
MNLKSVVWVFGLNHFCLCSSVIIEKLIVFLCGCGVFGVHFFWIVVWVLFGVWVGFWGLLGCGSGVGLHFSAWRDVGFCGLWVCGMLGFFGCFTSL